MASPESLADELPSATTTLDGSAASMLSSSAAIVIPNMETCAHRANNMVISVTNFGCFGSTDHWLDCETKETDISCEFPAGTQQMYLYVGAIWIGAIVGLDTLVSATYGFKRLGPRRASEGHEFFSCSGPECGFHKKSNNRLDPNYDETTVSDFDMIAEYSDSVAFAALAGPHKPLHLEVTQRSYTWSADFAGDFILLDYTIRNVGEEDIERAAIGVFIQPRTEHQSRRPEREADCYCGFRETYPSRLGWRYPDTLNLAWSADNDGDPNEFGSYDYKSVTGVTGLRIMQTPADEPKVNFNWFTGWEDPNYSWGPMLAGNRRQFATGGQGHPISDADKYYLMTNSELDYDQMYAREWFDDEGWLPPSPTLSRSLELGYGSMHVLSTGPFDIPAGDSVPFTIGYIAGEGFHTSPDNHYNHMQIDSDPEGFYRTLDFSDLARNAVSAYWVYDNPGYDTDDDGYAGPYWEIVDTLPNGEVVYDRYYYAGDGVPDFRAATPPPAPVIRFYTSHETVKLKWNGLASETAVDPFTGIQDFEGYRVYMGRLNTANALGLVTSHDFYNYSRFRWNEERQFWQKTENPFTLDSLKGIYGDDFDPDDYPCVSSGSGLIDDSCTYCFKMMDWNQSIDGWHDGGPKVTGGIRKTYIDEINAGQVTDEYDIEDTLTSNNWIKDINPLTGDSIYYHKFYEYEFTMESLLASVSWWFSVTAFDFGDAFFGIDPLESSPLSNSVETWAIAEASHVLDRDLKVMVYPNPYMGDGRYADAGYEDPHGTGFVDHERRIHFLNLPPRCTVKIFTVSGDLVRTMHHPGRHSNTDAKLTWNVRSTNNEIVTSGIYIYSVESEWGHQIGKIVIIL